MPTTAHDVFIPADLVVFFFFVLLFSSYIAVLFSFNEQRPNAKVPESCKAETLPRLLECSQSMGQLQQWFSISPCCACLETVITEFPAVFAFAFFLCFLPSLLFRRLSFADACRRMNIKSGVRKAMERATINIF